MPANTRTHWALKKTYQIIPSAKLQDLCGYFGSVAPEF